MADTDTEPSHGVPGLVLLLTRDVVRAGRLAHALSNHGLVVTIAFDPEHARTCLLDLGIQVGVVDVAALGDDPALELRRLRRHAEIPILALVDVVGPHLERLFHAGASAIAPIDSSDFALAAPVRALLGLADGAHRLPRRQWCWGPIEVDGGHRTVRVSGEEVSLTPSQLRLLAILISSKGDVVSHAALYRLLWRTPVDDGGQRLAAHVHRLRERLGGPDGAGGMILTVMSPSLVLPISRSISRRCSNSFRDRRGS
jgi:two-component system, OmpR family, response regulator MtrA